MVRMVAGRGQRAAVSTRTLRRNFGVPAQSRAPRWDILAYGRAFSDEQRGRWYSGQQFKRHMNGVLNAAMPKTSKVKPSLADSRRMNVRGNGAATLDIQALPLEQELALVREHAQNTLKALAKSKTAVVPKGLLLAEHLLNRKGSRRKKVILPTPIKQRRNKNRIDLYFGQGRNKNGVHFVQGGLTGGGKH